MNRDKFTVVFGSIALLVILTFVIYVAVDNESERKLIASEGLATYGVVIERKYIHAPYWIVVYRCGDRMCQARELIDSEESDIDAVGKMFVVKYLPSNRDFIEVEFGQPVNEFDKFGRFAPFKAVEVKYDSSKAVSYVTYIFIANGREYKGMDTIRSRMDSNYLELRQCKVLYSSFRTEPDMEMISRLSCRDSK